jgi:hypothetical protein
MILTDLFYFFLSIVLLLWCFALHPSHFSCPPGWHSEGVAITGLGSCAPNAIGDPEWDGTWLRPDRSTQPPGRVWFEIYCTGGTSPVVNQDGRVVGCQHVSDDRRR